jgi:flagellar basal body-associated protein FliL
VSNKDRTRCIDSPTNGGNEPTPAPKAGKIFTKNCRVFDDRSSECDGAFTKYTKVGTGEQREEDCAFCTVTGPKGKKTTCIPSGSTHYLQKSADKSENVVCSIYSEENGDDDYVERGGGSLAADDDALMHRKSTDDDTSKQNDDGGKNKSNDDDNRGSIPTASPTTSQQSDNLSSNSEAKEETTGLIVGIVLLAVAFAATGMAAAYFFNKLKKANTTNATTDLNGSTTHTDATQANPMHQGDIDVEAGNRMAPRKTAVPRFSQSYGSSDDNATEEVLEASHASFSGVNPMQDEISGAVIEHDMAPPIPPKDVVENGESSL